jgi:hypothetical protein
MAAVYIPIGHGNEDLTRPRDLMPEGCTLTILETPGGAHYWRNGNITEMYDYTQLTAFLKENADKKDIFKNPKENSVFINEIFGSVAIFGPGEKYPNIDYTLSLSWFTNENPGNVRDIRYSGLVPFNTFIEPSFTTKNIVSKLITKESTPVNIAERMYPAMSLFIDSMVEQVVHNYSEIYKYSLFPSPSDIIKIKESERNADRFYETFINVSLRTLMEKFPGNYIHLVCRGTRDTVLPYGLGYNPNPQQLHTQEEIFTKRIPFMSADQKRRAIANIEQSRKNGRKSRFNEYSTKNTRNIMLAGLKRSLVQNELVGVGVKPRLLIAPNNAKRNIPNETRKKSYEGKKYPIVKTDRKTRKNSN